jgi:hypothetical protein
MEVSRAFGLSSRGLGPGELISVLYDGPRWSLWRPPSLLALGAGSFVCPSPIYEVQCPRAFSFLPYAIKAPWSWGIAFWAFCTGLICGALGRLLHTDGGSIGGTSNTAPGSGSSDITPIDWIKAVCRAAVQGTDRVRVSLAQFIFRRLLRQILLQ